MSKDKVAGYVDPLEHSYCIPRGGSSYPFDQRTSLRQHHGQILRQHFEFDVIPAVGLAVKVDRHLGGDLDLEGQDKTRHKDAAEDACNSERDRVSSDAMSDFQYSASIDSASNLRKSERTRQAILDGALEFLWSRPFREMTVAERTPADAVPKNQVPTEAG